MTIIKVAGFGLLALVVLALLLVTGFRSWLLWQYHLPNERVVRTEFARHKSDYLRFVDLLNKNPAVQFVGADGSITGATSTPVSVYQKLMRATGAKFVTIREDRSVEFTLYGFGGVTMDDSYLGVRFVPEDYKMNPQAGWQQTMVPSLDPAGLPKDKGRVATGLYAVPIAPEWYIYRLECQE